MNSWLENIAYRIELGFTVFIVASFMICLIALTTFSFQAYMAARLNPLDTLRDE